MKANELMIFRLFICAVALVPAATSVQQDCCTVEHVETVEEDKVGLQWRSTVDKATFMVEGKKLGASEWKELVWFKGPRGAASEIQVVQTRADEGQLITSGAFKLSLHMDNLHDMNSETASQTEWIPYDATAEQLKASLESLDHIDSVQVNRSPVDPQGGFSWSVTFPSPSNALDPSSKSPLTGRNIPTLMVSANTLDANFLSDRDKSVVVLTARDGGESVVNCGASGLCEGTVKGLEPNTGYQFRVRALVNDVLVPYSRDTGLVFTTSPRKRAAPQPFRVLDVSDEHVLFTVPSDSSDFDREKVQVSKSGSNQWTTLLPVQQGLDGNSQDTYYQALGLEPLTEYALRMPHAVQQGNWHATTFKTAAPKKQKLELHVDSVEERNARLSWSIKNANCTRFELQTRKLLYGPSSGEEQDGDSRLWVDAVVANPKDLERSQVGVPEVQVIQTRADAGQRIQGGSFRLSFGKTMTKTERLPFDVSESHLKDELESIGVFASKVVRKGPNSENGFSWTILFDLSKHPGNQVQITVAEETLSSQSGATWSAPGSMVSISTVRDGSSSDSFPVSDNLEAEVLHLQPYRWYSFRVREVSADSISMWSAPTKPVRTKFDPFQHEDRQQQEQHAGVDSKEFEIVPGSNETAAKTLDPYYLTSVGNGGTSHFPRGGDGLIVFIPSSSFSAMARSKARPIFFQFTGKSETFIVPNDPLIDQIEVRAWGAGGATGMLSGNSSHGGGGAYVRATIHLLDADAFRTRGEKRRMKSLQVRVGGGGQPGRGSLGGDGGFGGGGQGGYGSLLGGGGGGGASVVLSEHGDVLVVAGGGGGGGAADYCCAHGGAAGSSTGFSGLSPSGNELIGLDRSNPLDDAFAEHENIELGFAGAGADFSVLSQGGGGAMPFQGGPAGMSGSYYSFQGHSRVYASGGRSMVGGRGGSGHNAGGGGGGGFYGGGGGGSGLDGGGGGGGSSFVDSQYLLSFTKMEDPTAAFDHFDPPVLFAAQVEPGHVKIRWEKQHGAAYSIDVAVGPLSHHFHTIHNVGREEEAWFIDTAVAPGTTYQYRARAVSLKGGEEFVGPTIVVTTPESHTNVWNPIFPAPPLKEALRYEKQLEKITSSRQALEEHLAASRAFTSEDRLSASVAEEAGPWAASSRATLTSWRPTSRYGSTGVVLGDYLYLYGGMVDGDSCDTGGGSGPAHVDVGSDDASSRCFSSRQVRDDVWRFDSELGLWEEIARRTGAEAPRGRMFHSAVALGGKMVVFGGQGVEQVATDQVVGNDCSGIQTQTESGSSRMTSFSICDEESKSPIEKEWQLTPLDDLWELDPGQPLQVKISSLAEWETGAGDAVFSEAKDVSFSLENATSTETGFCISDVLQVALRLKHPCPFKLQVSLMGPRSKARNREGDLGTVLMMPYQSARQFCLDESNDELLHTVTLSDSAAADLSSYVFESGTFQPVTPLHRYLGMRVDSSDVWKLRVVDQDGNLLGSSNGTLVSWELSMHVLPCGLEPSWKRVQVHSPVAPGPRYGHGSLAVGGESLFVFGGKSLDRGLLKDLWRFDVATGEWHELFLEQEYVRGFESGVVPAHPLVGLLKISSSLSIVETYDFREHLWNTFPVNIASGITTTTSRHDVALAFDERRNRVLLFGGRTAAGVPLNELLSLDLRNVTGYELEHSLCYGFEKTCTLANSTVCLNLARLFLESLCAASTVA